MLAGISEDPVLLSFDIELLTKFVPVILSITGQPRYPVVLVILVTVGGGSAVLIVKPLASIAELPPGFVTTTFHWPVIAPAGMAKLHVIFVGDTTVIFVAGMSDWPDRLSFGADPLTNPVPSRLLMMAVDPAHHEAGVIPVTESAKPDGPPVDRCHCARSTFEFSSISRTLVRLVGGAATARSAGLLVIL